MIVVVGIGIGVSIVDKLTFKLWLCDKSLHNINIESKIMHTHAHHSFHCKTNFVGGGWKA